MLASGVSSSAQGVFEHIVSDKILVILNPTRYMLTSSASASINLWCIL